MKRYIKVPFVLLITSIIFCGFNILVSAEESKSELFEAVGAEKLFDSIPDDAQNLLSELGITEIDFDSIFNVTAEDAWLLTKKLLTGAIESPIKSLVRLMAVIILLAVCECFVPEDAKFKFIMEMCGSLFCTITILNPVSTAVSSAVTSISVTEGFMLVLIPVLTAIVSVSGNPTLAVSFQSIAFAGAQIISGFASKFIVPLVGAVLALDVTGTLMPSYKLSGITDFIKKTITTVLSFGATLFVSFLGLKGALANAADSLASKGIKLVISSAVPVVGGAVSEAYSGVIGSMVLVKSTVGIFGICAVALINLPSCIQLLFWVFTLKLGAAVADLFEQHGISSLLKALSSTITLLNVVLLFVAVLFIISTALLLVIKAG